MQFQKISILPPQKGLEFPGGVGGSVRPKNLKKCMKLNWNLHRGGGGGGVLEKIPSVGEVWIFSGITQLDIITTKELGHQVTFLCILSTVNTYLQHNNKGIQSAEVWLVCTSFKRLLPI